MRKHSNSRFSFTKTIFYRHRAKRNRKRFFTPSNSLRYYTEGVLAIAAATEGMNPESTGVMYLENESRDILLQTQNDGLEWLRRWWNHLYHVPISNSMWVL